MTQPVLAFITRDSETKMSQTPISLFDVLYSTLQIPYQHIILIDDSKDGTIKIFKNFSTKHGKKLRIKIGAGNRAKARQKAIDLFLTIFERYEWILFVDDDVIFNPGWWSEAKEYLDQSQIGLLWGLNHDGMGDRPMWYRFRKMDTVEILRNDFWKRGGTHDTLIRRKALEGCKIPEDLHVFEDWYILKHVLSKGYTAQIMNIGVKHYNPNYAGNIKKARLNAYLDVKYEISNGLSDHSYRFYRLLRNIFSFPLHILVNIKVYGISKGIKKGLLRWITLFNFRIYTIIYSFKFLLQQKNSDKR
jgi:hypothetical protein